MKKVLVVDDSKSIQKLVTKCVQSIEGAEVIATANDGEDGLNLYKQLKPDLVLLDITMPNMDGRECLKAILVENPSAHVIMLSALNSAEVIQDCLTMGAKAFLNKPTFSEKASLEEELKKFMQAMK